MRPGEVLVVGSSPSLLRYRFSAIDSDPTKHPLRIKSAFGLQVQPASGVIAVCGAGGLDLLSSHGASLGAVFASD